MNPYGYLAWDGDLHPKWDMKFDLHIEKTTLNKKIYPKLVRQIDILKWLCSRNDIFCTMDNTWTHVGVKTPQIGEAVLRFKLRLKLRLTSILLTP